MTTTLSLDRLRRLLDEQRLNQQSLANKAGVSQSSVSRILAGRLNPSAATLERLAKALGVTVRELTLDADSNIPQEAYDVFLSYSTPDGRWVRSLAKRLTRLGLRVASDEKELAPGENWVLRLSQALACSRYLIPILSSSSANRTWVATEWSSYIAEQGPFQRVLPVVIDAVEIPPILGPLQKLAATDRDTARVAEEIVRCVGNPSMITPDDARNIYLGRDLFFSLSREDERLVVVSPSGVARHVTAPWTQDNRYGVAHLGFTRLTAQPIIHETDRKELLGHAKVLGEILFGILFDSTPGYLEIKKLISRPVVTISSADDLLLSLPWELLYSDGSFLVRDGEVELVRTASANVPGGTLLGEPTEHFRLVVNVAAPEGAHLHYEAESYRITLALADCCSMTSTELGTLDDLVETVDRERPTGIHFSGHGQPGGLLFEDDEGRNDAVEISQLVKRLREKLDDRDLPPLFYLASCHGTTPGRSSEGETGPWSSASQLHRAGITQVVGYFGPIADELSTRAEEAFYDAIARGRTTRDAIRHARLALAKPFHGPKAEHRPSLSGPETAATQDGQPAVVDTHPFAWSQLVLYHRGPEFPLSLESEPGRRRDVKVLQRKFVGYGNRKVLTSGFIGRRTELHRLRRKIREGERVFVLHGLGGLGKSTLAAHLLGILAPGGEEQVCTLWCQEAKLETDGAEALVGQLLDYCRRRFGADWEQVVQYVDRAAQDDSARRFLLYLQALLQTVPQLVLYLDNLESLLLGPESADDLEAFGRWASPELEQIWSGTEQAAREGDKLYLVASSRYRNDSYRHALFPVPPLPQDALYRMMEWFPGLQQLSADGRAKLVGKLDGHPRAVEYADDLLTDALTRWKEKHGEWRLPPRPSEDQVQREWDELISPALPNVENKLRDNLLLDAIWHRVLDEQARRMLYRMTVLLAPAEWDVILLLGDSGEDETRVSDTAERLRDTSLLEQMEFLARTGEDQVGVVTRYTLHPATARFVAVAHGENEETLLDTHRCLGDWLEAKANHSPYIETDIEAGHHLFHAGEYGRAYELLGPASEWLQSRGRVREGLKVLQPFLVETIRAGMEPRRVGGLLGTVGNAYARLGQVEEAIGFYEQQLVIFRDIGERNGEGNAVGNLGIAYADLGQVEQAISYYEQALMIARESGNRRDEGNAVVNLGLAYANLGEVEKAITHYEQALTIARETGDRRDEGNAVGNLGLAYASLGQVEQAIGYHEQALVIHSAIGDPQGEGSALGNLGVAFADLGQIEKAIGYHERALVIHRATGDLRGVGNALGNLGIAYVRCGQSEKAVSYHEQALSVSREICDRRGEAADSANLGLAYVSLGQVDNAIELLERALRIGTEIKDPGIVNKCQASLDRFRGQT